MSALLPALLPAVLGASLVGSLHCAGMCGPLVAVVVGGRAAPLAGTTTAPRSPGTARLLLTYHLARGAGYAALGAAAGAAGRLADLTGVLAGVQPLAASLAAVTLIVTGAAVWARHLGVRVPRAVLPTAWAGRLQRLQRRALRLPGTLRAGAIGASTALLPCGWLYAFATVAAGTGHPSSGALVMGAFWLGTLPVLSLVGVGVRGTGQLLGPRARPAFSALLIAVGVWALFDRSQLDSLAMVRQADAAAEQLEGSSLPAADAPLPCCSPEPKASDAR